jgi:hypothetical protein
MNKIQLFIIEALGTNHLKSVVITKTCLTYKHIWERKETFSKRTQSYSFSFSQHVKQYEEYFLI